MSAADEPGASSATQDGWGRHGLLALGAVAYGTLLFVWFLLPAYLSPIIAEFDLTGTQAGLLAGAVPLTYIPLALVSGLVIDRVGARRGIAAAVVIYGIAQAGRGVAVGFWSMLALTLLLGVGATGVTFGLPKLAAELYPADRVGTASAVYLVGSQAGTATAFGVGRPILGPAIGGWRPLFVASGLAALALAVVWLAAARLVPPGRYGDDDPDDAFTLASLGADVRAVVAHRDLRLLVVVGTMYLLVGHGLQGWIVAILEARGFPAGTAGTVASLLVVAQVVGVLSVPTLAERWGRRRQGLIACGLAGCLGLLALAATTAGGHWLVVVAPVALVGLGQGGLSPLLRSIPVELEGIGPGLTATALGLIFAVGQIGGFLGPVLVGSLHDVTGSYTPGLGLLATGAALAALAGTRMRELDA